MVLVQHDILHLRTKRAEMQYVVLDEDHGVNSRALFAGLFKDDRIRIVFLFGFLANFLRRVFLAKKLSMAIPVGGGGHIRQF